MRRDDGERIAFRRLTGGIEIAIDFSRERIGFGRIPRSRDRRATNEAHIGMVAFGMPERLTRADVDRIATLARLELSDAEKDLFVHQLSHVLAYAEQIQNIDTTGVPPTSHVLARMPADRADEPRGGLTNAEALANAPDPSPHTGLFRVPKVL